MLNEAGGKPLEQGEFEKREIRHWAIMLNSTKEDTRQGCDAVVLTRFCQTSSALLMPGALDY